VRSSKVDGYYAIAPLIESNRQFELMNFWDFEPAGQPAGWPRFLVMWDSYSKIIDTQKAEGIVEVASQDLQGVEFYIPTNPW
jgi:hypothetical protein